MDNDKSLYVLREFKCVVYVPYFSCNSRSVNDA